MKKWLVRILVSVVLVCAGGVAGTLWSSHQWHKVFSQFAATTLTEIALDAYMLDTDQADQVLQRKADALPQLVQQLDTLHRNYLDESYYTYALWQVVRYYETSGHDVPDSIRPILEPLPPRPPTCCELHAGHHAGDCCPHHDHAVGAATTTSAPADD